MPGIGNLNPTTLADGLYSFGGIHTIGGDKYTIREIAGRDGTDAGGDRTADRVFRVTGSYDPLLCRKALIDGPVLIDVYDDIYRNEISRKLHAPKQWDFTVHYSASSPSVLAGHYNVSIDTTGGSLMQTYGYAANTTHIATGETATDYKNALNVQDGKVSGVSRVIPALKISITARIATEYVVRRLLYAKLLAKLTGFTNSTAMFPISGGGHEFAIGELLFIGASGTILGEDPQITFQFVASENLTSFDIGDITGIDKKGHQFLWYEFRADQDATSKRNRPKIIAAHVGQVYGEADLGQMKIGVLAT